MVSVRKRTSPVVSTRPVTLPTTARGRQRRAQIVEAAAALMYERGIAATGLDEVLARSGAGKSQLYHYFSNKNDLVRAVIDHQLELVLAGQPQLHGMQTWADFDAWADALLARHDTADGPRACRLGSLAHEVDSDDELRGHLAAAFARWQGYLSDGLATLQNRGQLRPDADPRLLATGVMAAVQGGLLLARLNRDAAPLREALAVSMAHLQSQRR
jgi:AcrR family transcriptional regulator